MSDPIISIKDVQYVAKLARVAISEQEQKIYQEQLERILEYVAQLQKKNTDNVPPTAHPYEVSNVWREDEAKPFSKLAELFRNAPETEETYYKVKKVIE